MKSDYIDIIEKALSAYTPQRIRDYIDEVKQHGLKEHGFPRLGVNIGILIAYGRRTDLTNAFIEIMDICCAEIPTRKAANDFSLREVCCCLMLIEEKKTVSGKLIQKWKNQIAGFDPWKYYDVVAKSPDTPANNWALFAAVSEFTRGILCKKDTGEFVDWQLSSQLLSLDENGMYKDDPPTNPMVYDLMPRLLFAFLLALGYNGRFAEKIENALDKAAPLALKMQSVTGEIPYGGRSNQFLHNEAMAVSYYELEAVRFSKKGDYKAAGEFKAAARLAAEKLLEYLSLKPISHIKNRYDVNTMLGCENYGYFNKYMITAASNIYMGYIFADDSIKPTAAPCEKGGYIIGTSKDFHKIFLNAGGYFAEMDIRADMHYDANGIGRIHKKGCSSFVCLSVPFSPHPNYKTEGENARAASLCCYSENDGHILTGADGTAEYTLLKSTESSDGVTAEFSCKLSNEISVLQSVSLSHSGVDIKLSGADNIGFMLPIFDFDGADSTKTTIAKDFIACKYKGSGCKYVFSGDIYDDLGYFYNRNGRYRVMRIKTDALHIEISGN